MDNVDILIIGAGISGIGLAVHLLKKCPQYSFKILEKRANYGGTWDLFKYPGIRSDSDMTTFGYNFKPWNKSSTLADAQSIQTYLGEVISEYQLHEKIYYRHEVIRANYIRRNKKWSVEILDENGNKQIWSANFLVGCTGYYNYEQGYQPDFTNLQQFNGQMIHPQFWPETLDYRNQKVVIIGSGATAITLLPALVKGGASHVSLLQRSPTYIASIPSTDVIYDQLRQYLPDRLAYKIARAKNITTQRLVYAFAQKKPKLLKSILLKSVRKQLDGQVDMKHFTPSYDPWDQRLCVVPDGDLFQVLKSNRAEIETEEIEKFVENGIQLKSGKILEADIVVSATGLNIQILGGIKISIDEQEIDASEHMLYHGLMLNDVPNFALMIGYVNASWTLKVDIVSDYLCRLLNFMKDKNYAEVTARGNLSQLLTDTVMGSLSSGYISRAANIMPKQGKEQPWNVSNNYLKDRKILKKAKFNDGILQFTKS